MNIRTLAIGVSILFASSLFAGDSIPVWAANKDERLPQSRSQHLQFLGVPDWHEAGIRGKGVKVAVIDSGFRGYKVQVGKSLPTGLLARSARKDGNLEAKDSQHGILCGEVVHAIAPDAEILFANWDPDQPESFLDAVRWAKQQGAQIMTCSVVMPSWSDGEGNGPIHRKLSEILGDGSHPGDPLFFSCAGNTARRAWTGIFNPGTDGFHQWNEKVSLNSISPWGSERVSLELCWSDAEAKYALEIVDLQTGQPAPGCTYKEHADPYAATARFIPKDGQNFAVRVKQLKGQPGKFHFNSLAAYLGEVRLAGSICKMSLHASPDPAGGRAPGGRA